MPSKPNANPWEARAARNQALFRAINEELGAAGRGGDRGAVTIACECADVDCVNTLEIEVEQYERIRSRPTHFVVMREHVYPDIEEVVHEGSPFVVVEKFGEAGRVAAASDSARTDG